MDKNKLCLFVQELYLVKPNMDKTVFDFSIRAADIQMANLKEISEVSPLIVMADFIHGDL